MLKLLGKGQKQPAPASAAPAPSRKRSKSLTRAELDAAIDAACADLAADSSTVKTLRQLSFSSYAANQGSKIVTAFDTQYPVSVAELDAAISESGPADPITLSVLKRARALLAGDGPVKRSEPVQHVTVAQLRAHDAAMFDAVGWAIGAFAEEFNRSQPSRSHALEMLKRSATTPERKRLLSGIGNFSEAAVRPRTQEEHLRYQATGKW